MSYLFVFSCPNNLTQFVVIQLKNNGFDFLRMNENIAKYGLMSTAFLNRNLVHGVPLTILNELSDSEHISDQKSRYYECG